MLITISLISTNQLYHNLTSINLVNLIQIQKEEREFMDKQSDVLIKHQNLAIRNRSHKQETNIGKREAKEARDFKGGSLLAVGVTDKPEKKREKKGGGKTTTTTTERKKKTIKKRFFYNWQPFPSCFCKLARPMHGSIFSKEAHTLKKNMFLPRMTSIHQQHPPPRKYLTSPDFSR